MSWFRALASRRVTDASASLYSTSRIRGLASGITSRPNLDTSSTIATTKSIIPDVATTASNYQADPLVEQVVNNIMKHGKKTLARRLVSDALLYIQRISKTGDAASNPRNILSQAVDIASPLVKIASMKRGAKTIHHPRPISEHVRRRTGILWIVQAAKSRGKGKPFPERFGNEVLAVLSGESSALQKKLNLHKMALANRSNVIMQDRKIGGGSR
ncbi:hypothetical protein SmJEL517_g03638 [Synchytrium microbalum]|uniref:Small ribosomal subunit protein uS7 domain-containing protein n=1 Tax=Synchytrium microbalum TaxID=1806994 RepID=A0A507BXH5_9FUNG|nr:uncharacterized protein SmJEL517_g03638 [Synchytrium microbalum]TPX33487.1 hypothetical protein SmJEL517_g03638 [Synchytrium microbalum]